MTTKNILFTLVCLFVSVSAFSYVPDYNMILERTKKNHGTGLYQVNQQVVLTSGEEKFYLKEKWFVENEDKMRVQVSGLRSLADKINIVLVYNNSAKYYLNSKGRKKSLRVNEEWFEPYFHFQSVKKIKRRLYQSGILPEKALLATRGTYSLKKLKYEPVDFVRLSRVGGTIAYGFGYPTPVNSEKLLPGFWIEQDQFRLLKIRFNSEATVNSAGYKRFARGLWLPKKREVLWDNKSAQITITGVWALANTNQRKALVNHRLLHKEELEKVQLILPENELIKEFYKRFR